MPVYFSGRALTKYELGLNKAAIAEIGKTEPVIAGGLARCTYFVKPVGNTFTTTKGFTIYLSSDFFALNPSRRKEILVHEYAHVANQSSVGLALWLAQYLVNPWFRLNEEIAGVRNELVYKTKLNGPLALPNKRSIGEQASHMKSFYSLWFISVEKIANLLALMVEDVKRELYPNG